MDQSPDMTDAGTDTRVPVGHARLPVLITGANRGLGSVAARLFAGAGYPVALLGRDPDACERVAAGIRANGGTAIAVRCDIADTASVQAAVRQVVQSLGGIGVVVNNAGIIGPIARLLDADPVEWAHNISTNLIGQFHVLRYAVPHLSRGGAVINVISGAATAPLEGWGAYCAAKAGSAMLGRILDLEEAAPRQIRVFNFAPGMIDTDMQGEIRVSGLNPISRIPRHELRSPEEPARIMLWLVQGDSQGLAGQSVNARDADIRSRVGLPALPQG